MPAIERDVLIDRIGENPRLVVDLLVSLRILRPSASSAAVLRPTSTLRKLLGLPHSGGPGAEEEPGVDDPAAIVAIILLVIQAHGIAVPDKAWARIESFSEFEAIASWLRRPESAGTVGALFD